MFDQSLREGSRKLPKLFRKIRGFDKLSILTHSHKSINQDKRTDR